MYSRPEVNLFVLYPVFNQ